MIRESRETGKITPVSLFACMMLTKRVSGRRARTNSSKSSSPWSSTPRNVTSQPLRCRSLHTSSTAGCSTAVVMMWRRCGLAFAVPKIAVLLLSVAHEVNRICFGSLTPKCPAICWRAWLIAAAVRRAGSYIELGLK